MAIAKRRGTRHLKPVSKSQVKRFNTQQTTVINTRERTENDPYLAGIMSREVSSAPDFAPSTTPDFSGGGGSFDGGGASGDWD